MGTPDTTTTNDTTPDTARFKVIYSVRGAWRQSVRTFANLDDANQFALRWRNSNSTGHYVARIFEL